MALSKGTVNTNSAIEGSKSMNLTRNSLSKSTITATFANDPQVNLCLDHKSKYP